jgi:uncharacterized protein YegJ (DUF2314 family)
MFAPSILTIVLFVVVLGAAALFFARRRRSDDPQPVSIVLLLSQPKPLNAQFLAHHIGQTADREVPILPLDGPPQPDDVTGVPGDFVAGASPHFVISLDRVIYLAHTVSEPYWRDSARIAAPVQELRLRKAIEDHRAWLSMDILHPEAATPETYRIVGGTLARLIGDECLALFHPPTGRFALGDATDLAEKLRQADPVEALFSQFHTAPVVAIDDNDPRMIAATAEARRRFPEFEQAFHEGSASLYSAKARIESNGRAEHLWVEVERIADGHIHGRLGNDPVNLEGLRHGSPVDFPIDIVEDWAYVRGGESTGMFSVSAIQEIAGEEHRKR